MAYSSITMNASSTLDGRALAQVGAVTFNGSSGSLPLPEVLIFTSITRNANNSVLVLNTQPNTLVTLQFSSSLSPPSWTTFATNTPVTSPWTFTNDSASGSVTQRFYRAFIPTAN
jgi:hypothetical protein